MRPRAVVIGILAWSGSVAGLCPAQDLGRKLEAGPDGFVAVSFAARADVCGSGTSFLRVGPSGFSDGHWSWIRNDGGAGTSCEPGPVRLLLSRAEGRITAARIAVGTVRWPGGATDLGLVPARLAGEWLLDLAGRTDGRLGRDLLTAAALADSTEAWRGLAQLTTNRTVSRGLRESAIFWLGRELLVVDRAAASTVTGLLVALAKDPDAATSVREAAVHALGRAEGVGTAELVELAGSTDPIVARPALMVLGRSADPRARETLRRAARDTAGLYPVRVAAIRALGGRDATPADFEVLRTTWASLPSSELKAALLDVVGETGGAENARWLLTVARNAAEPSQVRARATKAAEQAGASSAELIKLYDEAADRRVRDAVLEALVRIGDRAARDKVAAVAQSDTDPELRRSALTRLAKGGDRRALALLQGVVER
jgi:HEAT repeat protein